MSIEESIDHLDELEKFDVEDPDNREALRAAIALLRTNPPAGDNADKSSDTSARLAAIKDIPTQRLIELAVAEEAGLISILPSAAERAHQDAKPSEPQGDGWIRINDRLPETGVPVLIHNPYWNYGVVANYAGEGVWMDTWRQRMTYTPTHWRPLPEPPKEEV